MTAGLVDTFTALVGSRCRGQDREGKSRSSYEAPHGRILTAKIDLELLYSQLDRLHLLERFSPFLWFRGDSFCLLRAER